MVKTRRWLFALGVVMLLAIPFMPVTPAEASGRTWTVVAGPWPKPEAVVSQTYFPGTITVAVGDTVKWKFEGFHTVTFLSGQKPPDSTVQEGNKTYFNPAVFYPVGGKTYDGSGLQELGDAAR